MLVSGSSDFQENKRLFYYYWYYFGLDEKELAQSVRGRVSWVIISLFGIERLFAGGYASDLEVKREVDDYTAFISQLDCSQTGKYKLDYLIVQPAAEPDWKRLDLCYEHGPGEIIGKFKIYRLTPKSRID